MKSNYESSNPDEQIDGKVGIVFVLILCLLFLGVLFLAYKISEKSSEIEKQNIKNEQLWHH